MKNHGKSKGVYLQKKSQLLIVLEYQSCYQSNAKTQPSYLMVSYEKINIWIFMNFNNNIKNECKIAEKSRGILTKLLISHLFIALEYQTCYQSNA